MLASMAIATYDVCEPAVCIACDLLAAANRLSLTSCFR